MRRDLVFLTLFLFLTFGGRGQRGDGRVQEDGVARPVEGHVQRSEWVGEYKGPETVKLFIEKGRLRVSGEHLPAMTLYLSDERHFFIRRTGGSVEFVRSGDGGAVKALVQEGGDKYEMVKVK